jgi:hypothetical protein
LQYFIVFGRKVGSRRYIRILNIQKAATVFIVTTENIHHGLTLVILCSILKKMTFFYLCLDFLYRFL